MTVFDWYFAFKLMGLAFVAGAVAGGAVIVWAVTRGERR